VKAHPFIGAEKAAGHGIARACRLLKVSRAAYYQRRAGTLAPRAVADAAITARITSIHTESKGTYGSPRVHQALRRQDTRCGKRRVARLMRAAGLEGRRKKRWRTTTIADPAADRARDLIQRDWASSGLTDIHHQGLCPGRKDVHHRDHGAEGHCCVGRSRMAETGSMATRPMASVFAGFRFPPEVISVAVRWYLRYGLSYGMLRSCWPSAVSPLATSPSTGRYSGSPRSSSRLRGRAAMLPVIGGSPTRRT
jgi:transposase InsO family protein